MAKIVSLSRFDFAASCGRGAATGRAVQIALVTLVIRLSLLLRQPTIPERLDVADRTPLALAQKLIAGSQVDRAAIGRPWGAVVLAAAVDVRAVRLERDYQGGVRARLAAGEPAEVEVECGYQAVRTIHAGSISRTARRLT